MAWNKWNVLKGLCHSMCSSCVPHLALVMFLLHLNYSHHQKKISVFLDLKSLLAYCRIRSIIWGLDLVYVTVTEYLSRRIQRFGCRGKIFGRWQNVVAQSSKYQYKCKLATTRALYHRIRIVSIRLSKSAMSNESKPTFRISRNHYKVTHPWGDFWR